HVIKTKQQLDERRLAGSRGPREAQGLPWRYPEADARQHRLIRRAAGVAELDAVEDHLAAGPAERLRVRRVLDDGRRVQQAESAAGARLGPFVVIDRGAQAGQRPEET